MLSRRRFVSLLASAAALACTRRLAAETQPGDFEVRDVAVSGDRRLGQRFTLLVPRHPMPSGPSGPLRLLVLLHGLGETGDPRAGVYAWLERYGLADAYARLRRPPLARQSKLPYWPEGRVEALNAALAAEPFRGLAIACPYTPDVYRAPDRTAALDDYAAWVADIVLPRARAEAPVSAEPAHTSLDGCSLGGYVGLEVFLRKPELFGGWGSVQGALSPGRASDYAERLAAIVARLGPRPIHLETSSEDPFRDANVALATALQRKGVPHELLVGSGPHNQPWLREAGTIEMLLWHDRLGR